MEKFIDRISYLAYLVLRGEITMSPYAILSEAFLMLGLYNGALFCLNRLLKIDPDDAYALRLRGEAKVKKI